jgi:hypothetical protein
MNKIKRENQCKATEHYRNNISKLVFMRWYFKYELSIEIRTNERIAILHYEAFKKNNLYENWQNKMLMKKEENLKEVT